MQGVAAKNNASCDLSTLFIAVGSAFGQRSPRNLNLALAT